MKTNIIHSVNVIILLAARTAQWSASARIIPVAPVGARPPLIGATGARRVPVAIAKIPTRIVAVSGKYSKSEAWFQKDRKKAEEEGTLEGEQNATKEQNWDWLDEVQPPGAFDEMYINAREKMVERSDKLQAAKEEAREKEFERQARNRAKKERKEKTQKKNWKFEPDDAPEDYRRGRYQDFDYDGPEALVDVSSSRWLSIFAAALSFFLLGITVTSTMLQFCRDTSTGGKTSKRLLTA